MSSTEITITPTEWEIMRMVWAEQTITSPKILELSSNLFDWKSSTVKTLIGRLIEKGYLNKDTTVRPMLLSPAISEEEANYSRIDEKVSQMCTKDRGALITHLIENNELSIDEIEEMIHFLKEKKQTAPKTVTCLCPVGQCSCHIN